MALKCLVFDCDGVLLDSVPVKTRAFARLAEPYGKAAMDGLVEYHNQHGGISRFTKFAWFFRQYLHREITPSESEAWGRKFAEYALDEVRRCEMIPGAMATLEAWKGKLPMYVCSGAPREELLDVLGERGLTGFFSGIYGSPPAKAELLKTVVHDDAKVLPVETLMVGDATTDRDAAKEAGTHFYGIGNEWSTASFPWSENLLPLNAWIKAHV